MRKAKKLSLNKELLKDLNEGALRDVAGGARTDSCPRYCTENTCTCTCYESDCFCPTRRC